MTIWSRPTLRWVLNGPRFLYFTVVMLKDFLPDIHKVVPTWNALRSVGNSKVVNSSFIWLIVIPPLSRFLEAIHAAIGISPTLPLNFAAFYFSAFFFTIAAILFNFFCPQVIKTAPDFGTYKIGGFSQVELKQWLVKVVKPSGDLELKEKSAPLNQVMRLIAELQMPKNPKEQLQRMTELLSLSQLEKFETIWGYEFTELEEARLHSFTVAFARKKARLARYLASLFYALGFILFAWVVFINLEVVYRETLRAVEPKSSHQKATTTLVAPRLHS